MLACFHGILPSVFTVFYVAGIPGSTHPVDAALDHPLYRKRQRGFVENFFLFLLTLFAKQRGWSSDSVVGVSPLHAVLTNLFYPSKVFILYLAGKSKPKL